MATKKFISLSNLTTYHANLVKFLHQVVTSLPAVATAKEGVLYLLSDGATTPTYTGYVKEDGALVKIGLSKSEIEALIAAKNVSAEGDTYVSATAANNKVTVAASDATKASLALADSALQKADITTGSANGTIAVDGTDVAVKGLGSAAYTESTAYEAAFTDGSATIASKTGDVVTLKAGVKQSNGAVAQGDGADIVLGTAAVKDATDFDASGAAAAVQGNTTSTVKDVEDQAAGKMVKVQGGTQGHVLTLDANGQAVDSGKKEGAAAFEVTEEQLSADVLATEKGVGAYVDTKIAGLTGSVAGDYVVSVSQTNGAITGEAKSSVKGTGDYATLTDLTSKGYVDQAIAGVVGDSVTDVQVDGTSVVTDHVASLKTMTEANKYDATTNPLVTKKDIAALEGAMHMVGVITRNEGETDEQAIKRVITDPKAGDVVLMADNAKEYVFVDPDPETAGDEMWREIGQEGVFVTKTTTVAGIALDSNISAEALTAALNDATADADGLMSKEDKAKLDAADVTAYTQGNGISIADHVVSASAKADDYVKVAADGIQLDADKLTKGTSTPFSVQNNLATEGYVNQEIDSLNNSKQDKDDDAVVNNIAVFDGEGNSVDGGKSIGGAELAVTGVWNQDGGATPPSQFGLTTASANVGDPVYNLAGAKVGTIKSKDTTGAPTHVVIELTDGSEVTKDLGSTINASDNIVATEAAVYKYSDSAAAKVLGSDADTKDTMTVYGVKKYAQDIAASSGVISIGNAKGTVTLVNGTADGSVSFTSTTDSISASVVGLKSAAFTESTDYATAAQGALADSALQAADITTGSAAGTISVNGTDVAVKDFDVMVEATEDEIKAIFTA